MGPSIDTLHWGLKVWDSSISWLWSYSHPKLKFGYTIFGLHSLFLLCMKQLSVRFLQHWEVPQPYHCMPTFCHHSCLEHQGVLPTMEQGHPLYNWTVDFVVDSPKHSLALRYRYCWNAQVLSSTMVQVQ